MPSVLPHSFFKSRASDCTSLISLQSKGLWTRFSNVESDANAKSANVGRIVWLGLICAIGICLVVNSSAAAQEIKMTGQSRASGTVRAIKPGQISFTDADGKVHDCLIQDKDEKAISRGETHIPASYHFRNWLSANRPPGKRYDRPVHRGHDRSRRS